MSKVISVNRVESSKSIFFLFRHVEREWYKLIDYVRIGGFDVRFPQFEKLHRLSYMFGVLFSFDKNYGLYLKFGENFLYF